MVIGFAVCIAGATLVHVYRGGKTLNDHAVALVVLGCIFVYPVLWLGLGALSPPLWVRYFAGFLVTVGMLSIYALFAILDRRVEAGPWLPIAMLSQLFFAFSLWTGLLLLFWILHAWLMGSDGAGLSRWFWPGWWLFVPTALSIWGATWTYLMHLRVRTVSLNRHDDAIRIVHLSDIHASPIMTGSDLAEMVNRTNALEPDVVLMTGDFVMPFSEDEHGYLIEALARIDAPAFACPGNHDLPVSERIGAEFEQIGVRWLVDESVISDVRGRRLEIAGVNFHWKGAREALDTALRELPEVPADYRILLAHDPRLFSWIPPERFDLQLSGHTHGGQVGTDMFGLPWSVLRPLGVYDQGLFHREGSRLYVHRGCWHTGLPPRMGIASEIVLLEV